VPVAAGESFRNRNLTKRMASGKNPLSRRRMQATHDPCGEAAEFLTPPGDIEAIARGFAKVRDRREIAVRARRMGSPRSDALRLPAVVPDL